MRSDESSTRSSSLPSSTRSTRCTRTRRSWSTPSRSSVPRARLTRSAWTTSGRTCSTAPVLARRSTSSWPRKRSPTFAGAPTCCRESCAISRSTSCATGSCSRTKHSRTASRPTRCCVRSSPSSPFPKSRCTNGFGLAMPPAPVTPEQVLQRLDWRVIRPLDGLLQGGYPTLFYGPGVDFADLREYQPGDDVRHIDWNVTARTTTPFVRQYLADRELTAWLLLDRSPSMAFGAADRTKQHVLTELVATLARLLTRGGNRVGAILYENTVEQIIEPRSGRNQVLRIARELLRPSSASGAETDLAGLVRTAASVIRRRSLVFVISDFISGPGWERGLALLAQRHEVVAIRVWDPREVDLPDVGVVVMEDSETGAQLFVDTSDPRFRRRFRAAADAREERLQAGLQHSGLDLFAVSTDEDLVRALMRLLLVRKQRRAVHR